MVGSGKQPKHNGATHLDNTSQHGDTVLVVVVVGPIPERWDDHD